MNFLHLSLIIVSLSVAISGCFNNNVIDNPGDETKAKAKTAGAATTGPGFTIITVTTSTATGTGTATNTSTSTGTGTSVNSVPSMIIGFNANSTAVNLTNVCAVQSGSGADASRACKCRFTWAETNTSDSSVINRTVDTNPSLISNFQTQCPAPAVYNSEISINSIIKISLVPDTAKGNNSGFTTNQFSFTKTSSSASGDFRDVEGRAYKNIFHYVCHDKFSRNTAIQHDVKLQPNNLTAAGITVQVPLANKFTFGSTTNQYSAQNYYFDFYVRSNELGLINDGGSTFACPKTNITQPGTATTIPSYHPLDSQFALSLNCSKDFSIRVYAKKFIANAATDREDPNLTCPTSGSGTATASAGNTPAGGVHEDIIGYAGKPNSDGSCPSFMDSSQQIRRTFRLRQYSMVYPIRYDADGKPFESAQQLNYVYILDRPVTKPGQNFEKPLTRSGPKPCPFSFKTLQFGYKCMTDSTLTGWSIDGTMIAGNPECPIYPNPPGLKSNGSLVIRPYKPFLPYFVENTSFKACAFQSSTPVDPEIVLAHDDNVFSGTAGPHDFYCAKHYPAAGAIILPQNGDPFDKPPGDCDLASTAAALKTSKIYSCAKQYDPYGAALVHPQAGCCQICSGSNCTAQGGGTNAAGRNAVFSPPQNTGNPPTASKMLPRAIPNQNGQGGCFDPYEP